MSEREVLMLYLYITHIILPLVQHLLESRVKSCGKVEVFSLLKSWHPLLRMLIKMFDQDVRLNIRLPDFTHLQGKFSLVSNLREVKNYVDRKQEINMGSYDLALPYPYPIKVFGNEDLNKRLLELEIVDKQTLIVVPHKKKQLYHRTRDKNTQ